MAKRVFFLTDYGASERFSEMAATTLFRDVGGLPLGNFLAHSQNRLKTCYQILLAAKIAQRFDRVDPNAQLRAVGATIQDKKGTRAYPAAHLAPCDIATGTLPGGATQHLHSVFRDRFAVGFIQKIFGTTEFVHKYVNYLDTQMERTKEGDGFSRELVDAVRTILRDRWANPRALFHDQVVPAYRRIATEGLAELDSLDIVEIDDRGGVIVDHHGEPFNPGATPATPSALVDRYGSPLIARPTDLSVNSTEPDALMYTRHTLRTILTAFATTPATDADTSRTVESQFQAIEQHEERAASEE
jgi:hypothetical protein